MENQDQTQRRKYYRLSYKKKELMPTIKISGAPYSVTEISEGGIRVIMGGMGIGRRMSGVVNMHASGPVPVSGYVLRVMNQEVIFVLTTGPSFKHMVEEQKFMRVNHPDYFPKKADMIELC